MEETHVFSQSVCSVGTHQYRHGAVTKPLIFPSFFGGSKENPKPSCLLLIEVQNAPQQLSDKLL